MSYSIQLAHAHERLREQVSGAIELACKQEPLLEGITCVVEEKTGEHTAVSGPGPNIVMQLFVLVAREIATSEHLEQLFTTAGGVGEVERVHPGTGTAGPYKLFVARRADGTFVGTYPDLNAYVRSEDHSLKHHVRVREHSAANEPFGSIERALSEAEVIELSALRANYWGKDKLP